MKICQHCKTALTAADLAADPYTKLCFSCWETWQAEAGAPLVRYGQPGTVCAACGMGFGGTLGFERHRQGGRCLSPAELKAQNRPLLIKGGIWVSEPPRNAPISPWGKPRSDFHGKTIPMPPLAAGDAFRAFQCDSGGMAQESSP